MKKILTVSLVAVMAVTAANADIASTKYVDDRTGDITGLTTTNRTSLTAAVNELNTTVTNLNTGASAGVATQITNALKGAEADDFSDNVKASLGLANTAVQTSAFNTFKDENTQAIADAKQEAISTAGTNADSKISAAKAAMNLTATGGAGSFIQQVAQTDGTVTATATAFETAVNESTKDSSIAPTTKAIKSYVDAEINNLSGDNSALSADVASLEQWKTTASTSIADNADAIKELQAADTEMDGRVDTLEADNTTNKNNITSLQTAVNSINNAEAAGSVANKIAGVEADLGDVSAANMGTTAGTVVGAINEVAGEAAAAQAAADKAQGEVDALEGVVAQQNTSLQEAISDGDAATLAEAKAYADTAEADAVAAAKAAGDLAYAAKSYEARVQTNETAISKINIATAQTLAAGEGDGQYALTMTKSGDTLTYKWEMIDRN